MLDKVKEKYRRFEKSGKIVRIPLGILCIIIGFIGGFIPIFQGWIFILLGCVLLFGEETAKNKIIMIKNKFFRKKL